MYTKAVAVLGVDYLWAPFTPPPHSLYKYNLTLVSL